MCEWKKQVRLHDMFKICFQSGLTNLNMGLITNQNEFNFRRPKKSSSCRLGDSMTFCLFVFHP